MASSTSTYLNNPNRISHKISTKVSNKLPPISYSRVVSNGEPVNGLFRIQSYYVEPADTKTIPVQRVNTYQEYAAGCTEHEMCLGHFCVTPRGSILLPQKMASTLGVMSNDYAKMAESIYIRDSASQEYTYREKLKKLMLGKTGKMRGEMPAGPVDGSARLVISLCWQMPPNHIAVPKQVAKNMKVLRIENDDETGLPLGYYSEDNLRKDDWVIVVRPPSLWAGNVQPMKVVLWDHECLGISPSNADELHADHDGDEAQLYFLGKEASLQQCRQWKQLNLDKFQTTVDTLPLPNSLTEYNTDLRNKFMIHSTLSIRELVSGEKLTTLSKAARIKEPMANMFVETWKNADKTHQNFRNESIRGIKDIMQQRLGQGLLGDMSRQARLAASCVVYKGNGEFHIRSSTETIRVINTSIKHIVKDSLYPLGGNSCMRAVSAICAVAQQAALDSHRVSQASATGMDLIQSLVQGSDVTLIAVKPSYAIKAIWSYRTKDVTYCTINSAELRIDVTQVIASYSPVILKRIQQLNRDIKSICKAGILMVCNYYAIKLSILELYSLVELLCHKVTHTNKPSTTKEGMLLRNMRWIVVVFANHYGKLQELHRKERIKRYILPETITDAAMTCNFDYINK